MLVSQPNPEMVKLVQTRRFFFQSTESDVTCFFIATDRFPCKTTSPKGMNEKPWAHWRISKLGITYHFPAIVSETFFPLKFRPYTFVQVSSSYRPKNTSGNDIGLTDDRDKGRVPLIQLSISITGSAKQHLFQYVQSGTARQMGVF